MNNEIVGGIGIKHQCITACQSVHTCMYTYMNPYYITNKWYEKLAEEKTGLVLTMHHGLMPLCVTYMNGDGGGTLAYHTV